MAGLLICLKMVSGLSYSFMCYADRQDHRGVVMSTTATEQVTVKNLER